MLFLQDENGATSLEYVFIAFLVGAMIIGALMSLGGQANQTFTILNSVHEGDKSLRVIEATNSKNGFGDGSNPGLSGEYERSPIDGFDNPGKGGIFP